MNFFTTQWCILTIFCLEYKFQLFWFEMTKIKRQPEIKIYQLCFSYIPVWRKGLAMEDGIPGKLRPWKLGHVNLKTATIAAQNLVTADRDQQDHDELRFLYTNPQIQVILCEIFIFCHQLTPKMSNHTWGKSQVNGTSCSLIWPALVLRIFFRCL